MSKVYVLWEQDYSQVNIETKIIGAITNQYAALAYENSDKSLCFVSRYISVVELDDPELLNRIAKESEKK